MKTLIKLLSDNILIEPSENIIKINPKIKIKLLNFIYSNCLLDLITKQLAIIPDTII